MSGETEVLACGTRLATLVGEVVDGPEPARRAHEAVCAYCQAALVELEAVWDRVRQLAREQVVAPQDLVANVIGVIRRQRRGPAELALEDLVPGLVAHALLAGERGSTRVADSVIADVAARATRAVPGVHALRRSSGARLARTRGGGMSVEITGQRVSVSVRVIVGYAPDLSVAEVVGRVRTAVITDVEALTGLEVEAVNISVEGLAVPED